VSTVEGRISSKVRSILSYLYTYLRNWLIFGTYNSLVAYDVRFLFGCYAHQKLPWSTHLPHPTGIIIGGDGNIGENVWIYQNVTIGSKGKEYDNEFPQIGDDVVIYSGAVVLGDIEVGERAVIAANSVVTDDVPSDSVVAGAPALLSQTVPSLQMSRFRPLYVFLAKSSLFSSFRLRPTRSSNESASFSSTG